MGLWLPHLLNWKQSTLIVWLLIANVHNDSFNFWHPLVLALSELSGWLWILKILLMQLWAESEELSWINWFFIWKDCTSKNQQFKFRPNRHLIGIAMSLLLHFLWIDLISVWAIHDENMFENYMKSKLIIHIVSSSTPRVTATALWDHSYQLISLLISACAIDISFIFCFSSRFICNQLLIANQSTNVSFLFELSTVWRDHQYQRKAKENEK